MHINIIGAGLAGCEAAYQVAKFGLKVRLYDIKPNELTPAHSSKNLAELVCSNSLKGLDITAAGGLIKEEMRLLDSLLIRSALDSSVPAGGALAVDRNKFSQIVTDFILNNDNIEFINCDVSEIPEGITIIATGPLTTPALSQTLIKLSGSDNLYFYDAAAPIVDGSTIDMSSAYFMDRYNKGAGDGDYLNCPMTREEYKLFYEELIKAQRAPLKSFEDITVFEGCMPIEIMASRGEDTMRYGPLKPVGLTPENWQGIRPYAVVQLRRENTEGSYFNLVGFQTNLTFSEQKRVFSLIPALKNAHFVKYGVMHRNTFINAPKLLDNTCRLKQNDNVFIAGQLSGVEGYCESMATGLYCGINAALLAMNKELISFSSETMIGALTNYISTPNNKFQPMNANYAIIKPLATTVKDKKQRYKAYSDRAINEVIQVKSRLDKIKF